MPRRHPRVAPPRQATHECAVVGRAGPQPDPRLEVARSLEPGRHEQALTQQLVQTGGGDAHREPGPRLEGAPAGHPPPGPGHEVVREQRLHDGPAGRLRLDGEMHDLPLRRSHRKVAAEPFAGRRRPRPARDGQRAAVDVAVALHADRLDVAATGSPGDDAVHGTFDERDAPRRGGLAERGGHAAPVDPGRARRMQHAVDRAQRREQRRRGGGRDLGHLARRAAQGQLGEGGEPAVLVGAQSDGDDPAGAVPGALDVGPVGREPRQQRRVVRAGLAQEGPERGVGLGAGGG